MPETIPSPKIARPRPLTWKHHLSARLISLLIRVLAVFMRFRWEIAANVKSLPPDQPVLFCIWHNRIALCLHCYGIFAQTHHRPHKLAALVSASRDGGVLSKIFRSFNVQPVRGSSSRRGPQALLELTKWAEKGYDLAITPDGPRGPRYQVQPGIVSLAQLTGMPILSGTVRLSRKYELRTWDRFQVPLPFSVCTFVLQDPLYVPREATETEREQIRVDLEARMRELSGE